MPKDTDPGRRRSRGAGDGAGWIPPLPHAAEVSPALPVWGKGLQGVSDKHLSRKGPEIPFQKEPHTPRDSLGNLWLGADQGSDSTPRPNEQP